MANEKSNNVRILQSTQKNKLPPIAHAAIGFLAGAALIIVAGLGYFYLSSDESSNSEPTSTRQDQKPDQEQSLSSNPVAEHEEVLVHRQDDNAQQDAELEDPKDSDHIYSKEISKAFNHAASEKVGLKNQDQNSNSPFEITQAKPQIVQQKPTAIKNPVPSTIVKPQAKITQSVSAKAEKPPVKSTPVEESYEEPMGGIQVSETRRPKVVATTTPTAATAEP